MHDLGRVATAAVLGKDPVSELDRVRVLARVLSRLSVETRVAYHRVCFAEDHEPRHPISIARFGSKLPGPEREEAEVVPVRPPVGKGDAELVFGFDAPAPDEELESACERHELEPLGSDRL